MNIGELFVKLGIQADTKQIGAFENNLNSARNSALALKAGIIALAYAIEKTLSASLANAVIIKKFYSSDRLSAQELQKWRYVADQNDISEKNSRTV
jgi:hypothetical protein